MAYAIPVLAADELAVLQEGVKISSGNVAVIAAGTGLGEGMLLNIGGRLVPGQSEGGADFAARTPRELEMVAHSPASSAGSAPNTSLGPGLVNVYRFTHDILTAEEAGLDEERVGAPAVILFATPARLSGS